MISIPVIVGPTGIGKSSFAIELAKNIGGEIVSCDSRQIYTQMDIGTAKATREERELIPHHLIDIISPDTEYSAGMWACDADSAIRDIVSRGKRPIICGGTMFYLSALRHGFDSTTEPDRIFRQEMIERETVQGAGTLHNDLCGLNPLKAEKIHPNDIYRIIRALQIERDGEQQSKPTEDIHFFLVEITEDRQALYDRINRRVDTMMDLGLYNEFQSLLSKGYTSASPGLNSVGYREFFNYIDGSESLDACVAKIKQNSRKYAKRQLTWLRNREKPDLSISTLQRDNELQKLSHQLQL